VYSSRIKIGPPLLLVKDIERELGFYGGYFDLQPIRKYKEYGGDLIYELGFRHPLGLSNGSPLFYYNTILMQKSLRPDQQDSITLQ
jgi:hypothetical protein